MACHEPTLAHGPEERRIIFADYRVMEHVVYDSMILRVHPCRDAVISGKGHRREYARQFVHSAPWASVYIAATKEYQPHEACAFNRAYPKPTG
jgi:hypothetical protein